MSLKFRTRAQAGLHAQLSRWMSEAYAEVSVAGDDPPRIVVSDGAARVQVMALPWGESDSTVVVRAYVVHGPRQTPELLAYLLHENEQVHYGAFALDDLGDLLFQHCIVGSTCQQNEFVASLRHVIGVATAFGETVITMAGGVRPCDIEDQQGWVGDTTVRRMRF
jgi:hypothetical protein